MSIRVGILNDMSDGPPGPAIVEPWLRLAVDDVREAGRLERDVEFVHAWGLGLPSGSGAAVERAFEQLASDPSVLFIVGPAIGDNALIASPLVERAGVPALNWAGAERARGAWMFHLQVGSHEDESIVLARHFAALGARRVAMVCDHSPIGERHGHFFCQEAGILGLGVSATAIVSPLAESVEIGPLLDASDALVYLGLGIAAPAVARAASNWKGPRAMNTAGMRGYAPAFARAVEGWVYVDMHSNQNRTLAALQQRLGATSASRLAMAKGYDLGRLVAEGLARAPELTRAGVRQGLEHVKWLPAAEGHEGTLLGFGVCDRGALHGRYLVLRQWRDGETIELFDAV
jgi:branched-chain amino acid transport system substrate-binding protein